MPDESQVFARYRLSDNHMVSSERFSAGKGLPIFRRAVAGMPIAIRLSEILSSCSLEQ